MKFHVVIRSDSVDPLIIYDQLRSVAIHALNERCTCNISHERYRALRYSLRPHTTPHEPTHPHDPIRSHTSSHGPTPLGHSSSVEQLKCRLQRNPLTATDQIAIARRFVGAGVVFAHRSGGGVVGGVDPRPAARISFAKTVTAKGKKVSQCTGGLIDVVHYFTFDTGTTPTAPAHLANPAN